VRGHWPHAEEIEMAALELIPGGQADRVQELVETADEPFYLYQ
jgi:hypothetical protein